mmetsp:Transcript_27838/g.67685  ORF Transcript_27838/g.67685 Transcript_27838/m.67685 type:complete len:199 (-) Transcript_27838:93-689(-)
MYNLKYGAPGASDEAARNVAKAVQLDSDVSIMQEGYETIVGERGARLSGGQRQRTALGRALLTKPDILVCDEVTGALDVSTEARLMKELNNLRRDKTTILIAHRLATVTEADEIIVMENGRIAERGTHNQLLGDSSSMYSKMWQEQMLEEAGEEGKRHKAGDQGFNTAHNHNHNHDHDHVHSHSHGNRNEGCGCAHDH